MRAMKDILNSSSEGDSARLSHPSVARNRDVILETLKPYVPATGTVLEIASGTGEHAAYLAPRLAPGRWLPSDPDAEHRASIAAWAKEVGPGVLLPVRDIDASAARWPVEDTPPLEPITAILAINMIHIAPWEATLGLMAAAGRILPKGGILFLYGAYKVGGKQVSESNERFEEWLKSLNPGFGVRDMETVIDLANENSLDLTAKLPMPANNFSLIFTARGPANEP